MNRLIVFFMFISLMVLSSGCQQYPFKETQAFVDILAHPQRYDKRGVCIEGYLKMEFEDTALYMTKDHAEHLLFSYAIWVDWMGDEEDQLSVEADFPLEEHYANKYVCVWGRYDIESGADGFNQGRITVWRIIEMEK